MVITEKKLSGIFSWKDNVSDYMKIYLKGTDDLQYVNNKNITNLYTQYLKNLSYGYKAPQPLLIQNSRVISFKKPAAEIIGNIYKVLNIPVPVIVLFLSALYVLSKKGEIDFKKYNPVEVSEAQETIYKNIPSEKPITKKIKDVSKNAIKLSLPLMLVAGAGGLYFLTQYIRKIF